MRPKGNGLVEIAGETPKERGFFCMQLVMYIREEQEESGEDMELLWRDRFDQAKSGECHYNDKCKIYHRTIEKHNKS